MVNTNKRRDNFFNEQYTFGKNYIAHLLNMKNEQFTNMSVLEVGGGEFGLLKALEEYGANCVGIEISEDRVSYAQSRHLHSNIKFYAADICDYDTVAASDQKYDLIILRDVIEHIQNKLSALKVCTELLNVNGKLYISYPPILSPFGGHQQNLRHGTLMPFIHILPNVFYKAILKVVGGDEKTISALLTTKTTGITIMKMKRLLRTLKLSPVSFVCYLIRPDYEIRFNLKRRRTFLNDIPVINEFITTGCFIVLQNA